MKRGACEHPKIYDLMERLGCDRPAAVGMLELLWHFTARYAPQGDVGRYSDARIEAAIDWVGRGKPRGRAIKALVDARWIDADEVHRLTIHDWSEHTDEATKKKLNRAGLCFVDSARKTSGQSRDNVRRFPPTVPDNGSLPEPEPSQSQKPEPLADTNFAEFIGAYPRKERIDSAGRAYVSTITTAEEHRGLMAGLRRWRNSEQWAQDDGRFIPSAERFLVDRRWRDTPRQLPQAQDYWVPPIEMQGEDAA